MYTVWKKLECLNLRNHNNVWQKTIQLIANLLPRVRLQYAFANIFAALLPVEQFDLIKNEMKP